MLGGKFGGNQVIALGDDGYMYYSCSGVDSPYTKLIGLGGGILKLGSLYHDFNDDKQITNTLFVLNNNSLLLFADSLSELKFFCH